ncbi:amidohydrolase family protein [Streptomyces sp. NPDC056656]|uniref:amidohydrolase family protein n=1 Tax=Streptomyces sp. NPDC056656 TaxID=3345895 RepID=UPI00367E8984
MAADLRRENGEEVVHGGGGALIPGLTDHHLHLFAIAAGLGSVVCGPPAVRTAAELRAALHRARPGLNGWVRGVRYHEQVAGGLDATALDGLRADVPVRVQHRSGALWVLNSLAAQAVGLEDADHPGIERDGAGRATGRLWRADDWLRSRLPADPPPFLVPLGRLLARYGITAVTDASPRLRPDALGLLSTARSDGDLPQRIQLLGAPLDHDGEAGILPGPWKIVLADSGLPGFDELTEEIAAAHGDGRPVAVHTVTADSLALALAAIETVGPLPGDRLEHAALVPSPAVPLIKQLGLRVVTQPGFLTDRGDDYLRDVPADEHPDLYRCASLRAAGIPLALSSDAPYGPLNPWAVMRAAVTRRTASGAVAAPHERLSSAEALAGYLAPAHDPGGPPRLIRPGMPADLLLLSAPRREVLRGPDTGLVRLTVIGGDVRYRSISS